MDLELIQLFEHLLQMLEQSEDGVLLAQIHIEVVDLVKVDANVD